MADMTREEAAALLERWAGKGLVPSDEECRKAFAVAIAALRSPGAAEMREAAIACVREQAPPRDIRTVVTEAQVSVLDRAIAAIRALPLPAPEVPSEVRECIGCNHWTVDPQARGYEKQHKFGRCSWMRAHGVEIETTGDCSIDGILTDATFHCGGWEAQ